MFFASRARLASWHPPMQRRRNLENSAVPTLLARGSRLAFRATMCRAEGDLEACWNRILTVFDPYTFSHSQGHLQTSAHPCSSWVFWSVAPSAAERPEAHKRVGTPRPSERSLLRSVAPSANGCDHCAKFRHAPDEGSDAAASPASPCAVPWWRAIRARQYAGGHGTIRVTLLAADPARNGDILPANTKVGARPCATRDGIECLAAARCSVEAAGAPARECRGPFVLVLAAISSSS